MRSTATKILGIVAVVFTIVFAVVVIRFWQTTVTPWWNEFEFTDLDWQTKMPLGILLFLVVFFLAAMLFYGLTDGTFPIISLGPLNAILFFAIWGVFSLIAWIFVWPMLIR